ncbi:MAG TPA: 5-dehydro-2-deoxygluconokinase [Candidatus Limnocylindria bacterium]|nr:5-dehydro-2-deoxygluconokinase [Candidatus Limnocylindria bacterium]
MSEPLELITIGRVGVDLYPEQTGVPLAHVRTFAKSLGGSPTNVAVAAARLGHRAAVITKVGDDGFGIYVREALAGFGVETTYVGTDAVLRTPVVFCELFPPDDFPLLFYRQPKAPDLNLRVEELDRAAIARVPILWTSGTALSEEPSRGATLEAARIARGKVIHDLDHRPAFWPSMLAARAEATKILEHAQVVVGNIDEVEMATGLRDPDAAAEALLAMGPELAIVKRGPNGTLARSRSKRVEVPAVRIEVVNGLGAGDAFGGALVHGLLASWDLQRVLEFASAAGAIVASRLACADAMPTTGEVDTLLGRAAHV